MQINKAILTVWMAVVLIAGAHSVPPGHAPPMPQLYQRRETTLPASVAPPAAPAGRRWHRPALAVAAVALGA